MMLKYGDRMLKTLTFVNKKNICKAGRILGVEKKRRLLSVVAK